MHTGILRNPYSMWLKQAKWNSNSDAYIFASCKVQIMYWNRSLHGNGQTTSMEATEQKNIPIVIAIVPVHQEQGASRRVKINQWWATLFQINTIV